MYEVSSGSVIGKYHTRIGLNNQDAYGYILHPDYVMAVVCDGCGSGNYSEVGARLGVNLFLKELNRVEEFINIGVGNLNKLLESVKIGIVNSISCMSYMIGDNLPNIIKEHFLFTSLIACVGKEKSFIASIGDGFYNINGENFEIGPFENNAPPYISYAIIPDAVGINAFKDIKFNIHSIMDSKDIENIMIATDGLEDFIVAEEKNIPGQTKLVGNINQFWLDDLYFNNKASLTRKLNQVSKNSVKVKNGQLITEPGILNDDTTIISIRKTNECNH